ncbi:MAG: helix-turn-helix domain-containing protein, partial [Bacillota bacterium]
MKFADFITNYLEKNNLSYRKMAELCDISHSEIGRLANGEEPSIKTINKISSAIDVSRTKLLRLAGYLDDNSEANPNLIED